LSRVATILNTTILYNILLTSLAFSCTIYSYFPYVYTLFTYTKSHHHYHNHHLRHVKSLYYDCFFFYYYYFKSHPDKTSWCHKIDRDNWRHTSEKKNEKNKPYTSKTLTHSRQTCVLLFSREIRDRGKQIAVLIVVFNQPHSKYTARTQIYTPNYLYHQQLKSKTPACDTMNNWVLCTLYTSSRLITTDAFFV